MSMTDPVADFLTRLRNAANAQHHDVVIPSSRLKRELARILKEQGYIEAYSVQPPEPGRPGEQLVVTLKYTNDRKPIISGIKRISRPGQREYVDHAHIPRIQGGMGTAIISTSKGVMTGHEARQQGVGGEVVAQVW
ncbi:MAG TPA: 30S ribosomal protein S8 [Solirubrobacteraceae bacterium]|nr:30S ribosomal protein S8 [Solirubrobacteraceae bacterium]